MIIITVDHAIVCSLVCGLRAFYAWTSLRSLVAMTSQRSQRQGHVVFGGHHQVGQLFSGYLLSSHGTARFGSYRLRTHLGVVGRPWLGGGRFSHTHGKDPQQTTNQGATRRAVHGGGGLRENHHAPRVPRYDQHHYYHSHFGNIIIIITARIICFLSLSMNILYIPTYIGFVCWVSS